jgi:sugar fermentation stimulation protein A
MADMVAAGSRAVMFYFVQRTDAERFTIAADIDPDYAQELKKALKAGVEAICYGCDVSPDGISIARPLTMDLPL